MQLQDSEYSKVRSLPWFSLHRNRQTLVFSQAAPTAKSHGVPALLALLRDTRALCANKPGGGLIRWVPSSTTTVFAHHNIQFHSSLTCHSVSGCDGSFSVSI